MKKLIFIILIFLVARTEKANATDYLVENGENFGDLSLINADTLLMTGGEGHILSQHNHSIAEIQNTEVALPEIGSIWEINCNDTSSLDVSGGAINTIKGFGNSTISISGGSVVWLILDDLSVAHISGGQFIDGLRVDDINAEIHLYGYDFTIGPNHGSPLTGFWEDGTYFSTYLAYSPEIDTIDHITFHIIPEPSTVFLVSLGGFILRKSYRRR